MKGERGYAKRKFADPVGKSKIQQPRFREDPNFRLPNFKESVTLATGIELSDGDHFLSINASGEEQLNVARMKTNFITEERPVAKTAVVERGHIVLSIATELEREAIYRLRHEIY